MKFRRPMTLGQYRELAVMLGGEDNNAVGFLDRRIALQGADVEVQASESEMIELINALLSMKD